MRKLIPSEDDDQIAIIEWSKYIPILRDYLIHIPNGGSRAKKEITLKSGKKIKISLEANRLKLMGVRAGVSDLFLPYPNKKYHGLWVELKRNGLKENAVSKEQLDWIDKMRSAGYQAIIAFGCDEAIAIFEIYLRDI